MAKNGFMWKGYCGNKIVILWLWAVGLPGGLTAQGYFNTIHNPGNNEPNVIVTDTGYVVLQQGDPAHTNNLDLKYFDLTGSYLRTESITLKSFYEDCRNCLEPYKKGYLKAATFFWGNDSGAVSLIRFDQNLDTIKTAEFSYQNLYLSDASGLKAFSNNEIMVVGHHYVFSTGTLWMLLARLDSNLNVSWEKVYKNPGWTQPGGLRGIDVVKTSDGGYMIGGIATGYLTLKDAGIILKMDSLGNEEWRKSFNGPEGNNEMLLHPKANGNFAFLSTWSDSLAFSGTPYKRLRLGEIDETGTILWDSLIGPYVLNMNTAFFEPTTDGNYITGGYAQNLNWGSYSMKFSESGDSIWFREYFNGNEFYIDEGHIESMAPTPDSGFVFCGYFIDKGPGGTGAHSWLIKTDKYGCDSAGCHRVSNEEFSPSNPNISVYPNPFDEQVNIELNTPVSTDQIRCRIRDMQGQLLLDSAPKKNTSNTLQLNTHTLKPGVYILEILHGEERIYVERLVRQ